MAVVGSLLVMASWLGVMRSVPADARAKITAHEPGVLLNCGIADPKCRLVRIGEVIRAISRSPASIVMIGRPGRADSRDLL